MRAVVTRQQPLRRVAFVDALRASWWAVPAVIAISSRLWGAGLLSFFGSQSWHVFEYPPAAGPATSWDGAWYLSIAGTGYHAAPVLNGYHDFAFWPAWPALLAPLIHLVPAAWADATAALAANALAVVALVLWARVLEPAFGRRDARYAIAFLGFAPPAVILSMAYSEPLFLLLAATFFLSRVASIRRPVLAALAQATRVTGFALGATALPALVRTRGRDAGAWLTLVAPVPVFLAWWLYIASLTGDPFGFMQGTPSWYETTGQQSGPMSWLPDLASSGRYAIPILITAVFMTAMVFGTVRLFRIGRPELGCYAVAALLPTLVFASWQSMPRHALAAVPAFAAAIRPARERWRWVLLAASICAEVVMTQVMIGFRLTSP